MDIKGKKVGLISLGCDKNRVDSEKMLASIKDDFIITNDIDEAQILIINTCAFLESARREAIQTVFDYLPYKQKKLEKIIMTGCLPQKFIDELYDDFLEVDGFLGTFDGTRLKSLIYDLYNGERLNCVGQGSTLANDRYLTTPPHYAYLKIADGCSNKCTYCLIPKIRGAFKSEKIEDLILEAKGLGDIKELILVAQDSTKYGLDIYGEPKLVELIQKLSKLDNIGSIRLLYCYPELVDDKLINEFKSNAKLIKYIDIPFQHASNRILKLMNRKGNFDYYLDLVNKLKSQVEGIAIRSTFIAGFPSESEQDFEALKDFLLKAKLFNAGFFAYSKEKDTPSYKLSGHLTKKVKESRVKELYKLQNSIMSDNLKGFWGKVIDVTCDGLSSDYSSFYGRAYFSAPEIDGVVYISGDCLIKQGESYKVKITKIKGTDLFGEIQ